MVSYIALRAIHVPDSYSEANPDLGHPNEEHEQVTGDCYPIHLLSFCEISCPPRARCWPPVEVSPVVVRSRIAFATTRFKQDHKTPDDREYVNV
jgi:hypothetical protein